MLEGEKVARILKSCQKVAEQLVESPSGARFLSQSLSVVITSINAKPKQTQFTFDTQVKTALVIKYFPLFSRRSHL